MKPETASLPAKPQLRTAASEDKVIRIMPKLAEQIGLNESIMLLQIAFWISSPNTGRFIEGKWWIWQSIREMQKGVFPFWSIATINRTATNLIEAGYVFEGNFNEKKYDKTRWFALNLEKVNSLNGVTVVIGETPLFQNDTRSAQNETRSNHFDTRSAQNETTIPETPTKITTENLVDNESVVLDESVDQSTPLTITPGGESETAATAVSSSGERQQPVADEQPASQPSSKPEPAAPALARRIDPATHPGETLIAAFNDVGSHWDKKSGWDNDRFVYVGRYNRGTGLKSSPWANPVKLPPNAPPPLRQAAVQSYRDHLRELLRQNPQRVHDLLTLDGKILVCWCLTDPALKENAMHHPECHAQVLVEAIKGYRAHPEKIPAKPVEQWYDHEALLAEVCRVFSLPDGASQAGFILSILRGKATKPGWKDGNLPLDKAMNAEMLSRWEQWYKATYPKQGMVGSAVKIQMYILRWWAAGCPVPDTTPQTGGVTPGKYDPNRPLTRDDYKIPDYDYTEVSHA